MLALYNFPVSAPINDITTAIPHKDATIPLGFTKTYAATRARWRRLREQGKLPKLEAPVPARRKLSVFAPTYYAGGSGDWAICARYAETFGVKTCFTAAAANSCSSDSSKCDHIVNVMYQLLDNNNDGVADDPTVVNYMVSNNYALIVPATEDECQPDESAMEGKKLQMSGLFESVPNSCDAPTNRGATNDRSTWAAAVDANNGCTNERDATVEEALHLITEAAGMLWPSDWGSSYSSTSSAACSAANGNCGWGYNGDYINPGTSGCTGQYACANESRTRSVLERAPVRCRLPSDRSRRLTIRTPLQVQR